MKLRGLICLAGPEGTPLVQRVPTVFLRRRIKKYDRKVVLLFIDRLTAIVTLKLYQKLKGCHGPAVADIQKRQAERESQSILNARQA